ncbi:uncharacterized protein GGS22DRAFT_151538 [Annulohypoxylon maeteangense]|uniref:uncharacterized protein n=1 Tax=Annulohypoxylon maeteangense TaxID=1927788 RepID=UPI00200768EC|nr:uncharacterized protein GGS22DRAFT_151538 [Annulohypoxylon maeteangense]KAI0890670.1 hypothetical protein GGS22DRAFT_151538 [Annulohypoxylon maeteangense]
MSDNQQLQLGTELSSFPQFNFLPMELQLDIWEKSMEETPAGFVLLSGSVQILQAPPAIAHVCKASRGVALKSKRIYKLEDGRTTWFNKETDYFLWGGYNLGLGELAPAIQNIVIPRHILDDHSKACEAFEVLLTDSIFSGLRNIFVNLENNFTFVDKQWGALVNSELFQPESNTIVVPDLNLYNNSMDRIDRVVSMLPPHVAHCWNQHKEIAFNDMDDHWWVVLGGDVMSAFLSTVARLCGEITEEQFEQFEAGTLMHPSGNISWWDFLFEMAPNVLPTQVFARITSREKVEGIIGEGVDLL